MKSPKPDEIRGLRERFGISQREAGELVHVSARTWQNWEAPAKSANNRPMPAGLWELFILKTKRWKPKLK